MEKILLEWNCTSDRSREILTKRSIVFIKEGEMKREIERERKDILVKAKITLGRSCKDNVR